MSKSYKKWSKQEKMKILKAEVANYCFKSLSRRLKRAAHLNKFMKEDPDCSCQFDQ